MTKTNLQGRIIAVEDPWQDFEPRPGTIDFVGLQWIKIRIEPRYKDQLKEMIGRKVQVEFEENI